MALESTNNTITYNGNGSVKTFSYDFIIYNADHLKIYFDDIQQKSGFVIKGVNNTNGGNVIFTKSPQEGVKVRLDRTMKITQSISFMKYGNFKVESIEHIADTLTMYIQQLQRDFNTNGGALPSNGGDTDTSNHDHTSIINTLNTLQNDINQLSNKSNTNKTKHDQLRLEYDSHAQSNNDGGGGGNGTGVLSVNGKTGSNITLIASDLGAVPVTRTINNKPLSSNVSITLADLGYTGAPNANKYIHSINSTANINTSGAQVIDQLSTNEEGHITVLSKRTMTAADLDAVSLSKSSQTIKSGGSTSLTITGNSNSFSELRVLGGNQGHANYYLGQSISYGGGVLYSGDGSATIGDEPSDRITHYRRNNGVNKEVFSYSYNNSEVKFKGAIKVHDGHEVYSRKDITSGTGNPSGGSNGDIYIQY